MNSENECDCEYDLNIRKPDEVIKEQLIYDNIDEDDEEDDELKLALSVSENEYYENNLLVQLENELETVLQFSKNEYDNYLILEENKLMEMEQNIIIQKMERNNQLIISQTFTELDTEFDQHLANMKKYVLLILTIYQLNL